MNYENYFKDLFESIPDYRKIVFLILLIQNDQYLSKECGFLKIDVHRLSLEFKKISLEEIEDYIDYIKNEEESIFERFPNK